MPAPCSPRRCILIVEDDKLSLKLLYDILQYHSYDVIVARCGAAAIDTARREAPALILLDIRLPDFPGTDVARRLKTDPHTRSIPIVATTALAMRNDRACILESGCDEYVSKPTHLPDLLALVKRYIGGMATEAAPIVEVTPLKSARKFGCCRGPACEW